MERPNPDCVVKVGDGRGFIILKRVRVPPNPRLDRMGLKQVPFLKERLIVTAAHCLPSLPRAFAGSTHDYDRFYKGLLGTLDGSRKGISAKCLFADPIADIAVLGEPDNDAFYEELDGYFLLTDDAAFLGITKAKSGLGWVLALDGRWVRTRLEVFSGIGGTSLFIDPTEPGMSGSPVLNDEGRAVGVIAIGTETRNLSGKRRNQRTGPQPILARNLPGWLLH